MPLVTYLCHESCKENGSIFESAGGWNAKVRWQRSEGVRFDSDKLTPELIKENFKRICSFEGKNEYPNYDPNWGHKVNEWMAKPKL